jgi:hypothetical protein
MVNVDECSKFNEVNFFNLHLLCSCFLFYVKFVYFSSFFFMLRNSRFVMYCRFSCFCTSFSLQPIMCACPFVTLDDKVS